MNDPVKPNGADEPQDPPETSPNDDGGRSSVEASLPSDERGPESGGRRDTDASELRSLLRTALDAEPPEPVDVLSGVQAKLRERSRGKFYGDGWSTSKAPPISTYLITSLVMLAVVLVIYAILAPLSGEPADIDTTPKPVRIIPSPTK